MKIISTKVHGILDYLVGILFLAFPYIAAWDKNAPQSQVLFVLGALTLIYSIMTRYELGLFRLIPFGIHLMIDFVSGVFLAASPWLLGFADEVEVPHLLLGIFEIAAVMMTRTPATADANLSTGYRSDVESRH